MTQVWATNTQRKKAAASALFDHLRDRGLSKREIEVIGVALTGCTNLETSKRLFVDEKTVKFHLSSIHNKMATRSRFEVLVYCYKYMLDRM